jgi:hypothetical protein
VHFDAKTAATLQGSVPGPPRVELTLAVLPEVVVVAVAVPVPVDVEPLLLVTLPVVLPPPPDELPFEAELEE